MATEGGRNEVAKRVEDGEVGTAVDLLDQDDHSVELVLPFQRHVEGGAPAPREDDAARSLFNDEGRAAVASLYANNPGPIPGHGARKEDGIVGWVRLCSSHKLRDGVEVLARAVRIGAVKKLPVSRHSRP